MKRLYLLLLVLLVSISSCTSYFQVEKRHYRKGFYVQQHHSSERIHSANSVAPESAVSTAVKEEVITEKENVQSPPQKLAAVPVKKQIKKRIYSFHKNTAVKFSRTDTIPEKPQAKPEKDPYERPIKISRVMGINAIVLVCVGFVMIETFVFGLVLLLIGFGCAWLGLKFGRMALNSGSKKRKRGGGGSEESIARRKRAKKAYWLNLTALLILIMYPLIRVGFYAISSATGVAIMLLLIALMLFILFKLGVFRDLKD